jgi:hypothetical protein
MATDWQRNILGDLVDKGYTLVEWVDALELRYKDKSIAVWHPSHAEPAVIRETALRHYIALLESMVTVEAMR